MPTKAKPKPTWKVVTFDDTIANMIKAVGGKATKNNVAYLRGMLDIHAEGAKLGERDGWIKGLSWKPKGKK